MSDWFKDWFSSEDYLDVYKHRDNADAEKILNLIFNNVALSPNDLILDMACGFGRHSILLAKKGFSVVSIDLSKKLLKLGNTLSEGSIMKPFFVASDMRSLCFKSSFRLVLNLFTSFGYFNSDKENMTVLRNAFNLLKKNSYFIIDYFNKEFLLKSIEPASEIVNGQTKIIQKRRIEGDRIIKTILIERDDENREFFESVKLYSKTDICKNLEIIGFEIKNIYGDYNGADFNENSSPRVIILATKR